MNEAQGTDYEQLARQLVRTLRGRRSQQHLSRRLGYRSNALYTWEAGTAFPTAARAFELAERVGVDLLAGLARFYRDVPEPLREAPLSTPEGVRRVLVELRGRTRIVELARATGVSRFAVSRWLSGKTQPSLPELLCFVDHASLRLLDFIAICVDPGALPATAERWQALQQARTLGYRRPATQAVLRALETEGYRARPGIEALARLTGMAREEVRLSLQLLVQSGQVVERDGVHAPSEVQAVDFRREPRAAQALKAYWAGVAAERAREARPGLFAYNVFAVSRRDLERLEALQRAYLKEMRTVIASSEPCEVVALANFQLFALQD